MRLALALALVVACKAPVETDPDPDTDTDTDSDSDVGTDTDPDTTTNVPPAVTAQPVSLALVGDPIFLRADVDDHDGDVNSVVWAQTAGPTVPVHAAEDGTAFVRPRQVGNYTFTVTASDPESSDTDTVSFPVYDLDGGAAHSVFLTPSGALWSWGYGLDGATGAATSASRFFPGPVCAAGAEDCDANPLVGAAAVAAGQGHTLVLTAAGGVLAFGANGDGQLGDGTFSPRDTPGPVCAPGQTDCAANPLTGAIAVAAGYRFSLALMADGTVLAWGTNRYGELGDGGFDGATTPRRVCAPGETAPCEAFLDGVVHLRAGGAGHALALTADGALYGWGHNKRAQTGNGDPSRESIPVPERVCAPGETAPCEAFLEGVVEMDPWSGHSLAMTADGTLYGWGSNDESELAIVDPDTCNGTACVRVPTRVCATGDSPCSAALDPVGDFAAGRRFSLARLADGSVLSWGYSTSGALGDGFVDVGRSVPGPVCALTATRSVPCTPLTDIAVVATGDYHAFALTEDGALYAWGADWDGQVGDGDEGEQPHPHPVQVVFPGGSAR